MNTHVSDKTRLASAIDTAVHALLGLKAGINPSSIFDLTAQAESAEAYSDHVRKIVEITGDLRVASVEIAAQLGEQIITEGMRKDIRGCDLIDDVLTDVQSWCDEVREGE